MNKFKGDLKMANTITIVRTDDPTIPAGTVKHVYTYTATTHPRTGEYIQVSGHSTYVVERVVHNVTNGSDNIVVEVKLSGRR